MRVLKSAIWTILIATIATVLLVTTACTQSEPQLRVASNVWPGYELLYLAREKGYFSDKNIRLVELPSATVCLQALAAGNVEGAMLTLDEVLTAKSEGLDLVVVAILDVSRGADVLLTRPEITKLSQLKGKRIGVEQSAVGAVMLDAALKEAGLTTAEIKLVYLAANQHQDAYLTNKVDALITFEPMRTKLIAEGARPLFDSSQIPGRIVDVLAVLPKVIKSSPINVRTLVASHFKARDYFLQSPSEVAPILAKRLQLPAEEVQSSYTGLELPDLQKNQEWLNGSPSHMEKSAAILMKIMLEAKLLNREIDLSHLFDRMAL